MRGESYQERRDRLRSHRRSLSSEVRTNWGGRDPSRVPQTGWDGDDWQDVRPRRGRVRRQDDHGYDGQQGIRRLGGYTGSVLRQSRVRVSPGSRTGTDGRGIARVSHGSGAGKGILRWRHASGRSHRSEMAEVAAVGATWKLFSNHRGMGSAAAVSSGKVQNRGATDETVADSSFKRFVM